MYEVVALKVRPQPTWQRPLMAAVMHHVISQVGRSERAAEHSAASVAENPNGDTQDHPKYRHGPDERHDVSASVRGIGMMATVHQEAEPRCR